MLTEVLGFEDFTQTSLVWNETCKLIYGSIGLSELSTHAWLWHWWCSMYF